MISCLPVSCWRALTKRVCIISIPEDDVAFNVMRRHDKLPPSKLLAVIVKKLYVVHLSEEERAELTKRVKLHHLYPVIKD